MTQTPVIHLHVKGNERIPLRVNDGGQQISFKSEPAQIIQAISPTIEAERNADGALLTITDYRGSQQIQVYDGQIAHGIVFDGGNADG